MKKLFTTVLSKLVATAAVLFLAVSANAQVATNYTFAQSSGVYTSITGGTVVATAIVGGTGVTALDDNSYTGIPIPFTFTFNSIGYTSLCINTNGFITFGATTPAGATYTPISGVTGYAGAISGIGRDLQGNVTAGNLGEIRYEVLGTTPTQTFVIQYSNWRRFSGTDDFDFQIRLEEGTNVISVVHGVHVPIATSNTCQVGLRGATNADFNNRTSTTTWAATTAGGLNTSAVTYSAVVFPTTGQMHVWTPVAACAGTPTAGTITGASAICAGTGTTLTLSGYTLAPGITIQWQSSTVPGGPYTNMGTAPTQATGNISVPMYYIAIVTCTNGGASATTAEFTVNINAAPTISVTPTSTTMCNGAAAIPLTASGSSVSYSWGPAAGLSSTTGSTVNANPAFNTTYTVTGTASNGCTAAATTTVGVIYAPVTPTVTATPPSVCFNGNSQLQALSYSAEPLRQYTYSTGTGATLNPMTGATQVIGTGNDDTPTAAPAAIGFTFPFNGTTYTQYSVSPDGWILLGGATATGQFANNVTSTVNIPKIYPLWDDLATGTTGNVQTLVTGTAPNRIFIVQWFVTIPRNTAGPANSTFQCWMYETSGVIEFRYGTVGTAPSYSGGATASATNFQSITFSSNTASVTVGNNTNAVAIASGRIHTLTPPALSYAWTPATFLSSTTIYNPMANGVTATTTWSVTASVSGCAASPVAVTVTTGTALSSSGSISPASTVCQGTNVTLNSVATGGGAPYTYSWTGPNSFTSTLANPTINGVTPSEAGTYTVVITDACAATSTVTLTLAVNAAPTVAVTPTVSLYCSGSAPIALTASGTATGYTWGPAAGLSATTGATVNASPSVTTTYTVTGTDGNGCMSTATTTVNAGVTPTATASANPASICTNGTSTLTVVGSVPVTYCQPVYSTGTQFGDYVSNVAVNTLNSPSVGAATPYYTLFPASGNTTTTLTAGTTYTITLVAGTYTINDLAAWIDYNQNGTLNNPGEKLGETNDLGAAPASTSFIFTVPINALNGTTRLRVRDMDYAGTNIMDPCAAQSIYGETEDYVITIVGGVDAYSYAWSPATFLNSTTVSSPVASAVTATTTYSAVITGVDGCTASASTTLTVNALPTVTASATPSTVCAGEMVTATGGGATSYTWTGGIMNNVAFAAMTTTTYTVTGTDANGCTNTATALVTVNALPTVTATATPSTVCTGEMVTATGGGATSYTWTGGIMDNVAFAAMTTTTYTVTGTDGNGCSNTASTTVTVNALPTVTASATPSTVCTGDMVTPNGGGASTYAWTGGLTDGVAFSAMVSDTYTVTGTDANGCSNTATVSVTVNTIPTVTASLTPSTACVGDMVTPAGSGASTYMWTGGLTDGVAFPAMASDTYTVTGTDANGCSNTTTVSITVNALPTVTASSTDSSVCVGDQITFMGGGATTYTWDNGVTDMVPYTVSGSMTFIVTGTDANGCMDTASLAITATALPNVTLSLPLDTACLLLGPVTLGGETPAGGTWSGTGVTGNSFNPGVAGNGMHAITYTYMDSATGCSASAIDSILVDICNSIDNNNLGSAVVYPNPNNGDFTLIPAGTGLVDVYIYNATGQLVVAQKATCGVQTNVSLEASGMYSVVIVTANGTRTTQRVVVNR